MSILFFECEHKNLRIRSNEIFNIHKLTQPEDLEALLFDDLPG